MNSRQRFTATMNFNTPDRVPLFQEGIRDEVLEVWHAQGLPGNADLKDVFPYDQFEEVEPDLDPWPAMDHWFNHPSGLKEFSQRLNSDDPRRLPSNWREQVHAWQDRQHVLWFRAHRGFFLTMGVEGWQSFTEAMHMLVDHPKVVHDIMGIQAEFAARLAERILKDVQVDGVIFNEPIAGNFGPLISPDMYQEFVLQSYKPVLDVFARHQVQTMIMRTYANPRLLLPVIFKSGFNCLWACECNPGAMDYLNVRSELGPQVRLIGGIDTDVLLLGKEAIHREIMDKVPPLLAGGGFVPLADGRVRDNIPFENYVYYRRLLGEIVGA